MEWEGMDRKRQTELWVLYPALETSEYLEVLFSYLQVWL